MKKISKNNRIMIVLLASIIMLAGISSGIQDAFSRYVNETRSMTMYRADATYHWAFAGDDVEEAAKSGRDIPVDATEITGATVHQFPSNHAPLILELKYPEGSSEAAITLDREGFPRGIHYSFDGDKVFQLGASGYIKAQGEPVLFLEFPEAVLATGQNASLFIYFFGENVEPSYAKVPIRKITSEATCITLQETGRPILSRGESLTWNIKQDFLGLSYTVQMQYLTAEGYIENPMVGSLEVVQTIRPDGSVNLTLSNEQENPAKAGTYRMIVSQTCEIAGNRYPLQNIYVPVFVNNR